jgi:phenylacetate-CoA ligase
MLAQVLESNSFYQRKLSDAGLSCADDVRSFDDYKQFPFTTKAELSGDQVGCPPYGTNLTFPRERYIRIHQTSGTTGQPLRWLDTDESWNWWGECWRSVYEGAGVNESDRLFFAFSFGPFIGFWSAYDAARLMGGMVLPGGGMSSLQRIWAMLANEITVLVCTPTYALHLAEVARREGVDLPGSSVRITIHAGEPGAGVPATRARIESTWGARCFDHAGATEVGAWGFECAAQAGLHLNEDQFIFEIIDPDTEMPAHEGELIVTNLGRMGMPVIRYRTGDRVRLHNGHCECGGAFRRLDGGVIGRIDDMLVVRGVKVFPSALEDIVRRFPAVVEYAVDVRRRGELDELELRIEIEGVEREVIAKKVAAEIQRALALRADVRVADPGELPRFELKARRVIDHRKRPQIE